MKAVKTKTTKYDKRIAVLQQIMQNASQEIERLKAALAREIEALKGGYFGTSLVLRYTMPMHMLGSKIGACQHEIKLINQIRDIETEIKNLKLDGLTKEERTAIKNFKAQLEGLKQEWERMQALINNWR